MEYRVDLDGDVKELKASSAVFSKWGSVCDLLEHAGLLDHEQATGVYLAAAENNITPAEFLYGSKAMSPDLVRATILCQHMLRDRLMTLAVASEALKYVAMHDSNLENALDKIGWNRKFFEHLKLSCCLLLDAGIIGNKDRENVLQIAVMQNVPLVRVIQDRQFLSQTIADAALNLESLVYSETIAYDIAVELLILCQRENIDLGTAVERMNLSTLAKQVKARLGELLVASGLVQPVDLLAAVERSLVEKRRLGEVLVFTQLLGQEELDTVLQMQGKIHRGEVALKNGIEQLKMLKPPAPPKKLRLGE
ncbi:MAG: hypothetical protein K2Z81_04690 [Cyanobacteria bacterium]|nr:hypothetical protein [Cyanobacteriota bacterium]